MITYHFDLYPRTAPVSGARIARLSGLLAQRYRGEANGTGSGQFAVRGTSSTAALLNPLGLEYVRVVRSDGASEAVVGGFWTENGTYQVINRRRTRRLVIGGAGTLAYLARGVMADQSYLTDPFIGQDPFDDTWRLFNAGTGNALGQILWRVIRELQEAGRPRNPIPGVVMTFDYTVDSNGVPWSRSSGDFTAQVGESVLMVIKRLMQMGLYVSLDPDTFELNAYEPGTHERDRTGLAWGANVVRFQVSPDGDEANGNILNESERGIAALVRRSDLLVGDKDVYEWVSDPGADIVWEGAFRVEDESGASFPDIGQAQLDARSDRADPGRVRVKLGETPAAGTYLPFEAGGVLVDDLVTVDSGSGTHDWSDSTQRVAALTIERRRGGDWELYADLGTRFTSVEQRQFQATPVGPHNHPANPRICKHVGFDVTVTSEQVPDAPSGTTRIEFGYVASDGVTLVPLFDTDTDTAPQTTRITATPVKWFLRAQQTGGENIYYSDNPLYCNIVVAGGVATLNWEWTRDFVGSSDFDDTVVTVAFSGTSELRGSSNEAAACDHRHLLVRSTDPTVNDDETAGLRVTDGWLNTTSRRLWILTDSTAGAAEWIEVGGAAEEAFDHGNMGAAETLDVADGTWHRGTLDANCTITVQGFTVDEGVVLLFKVAQDATGGRSIIWDGDVVWQGDNQPAQGANQVTWYAIWSDQGDSVVYGAKVGAGPALIVREVGGSDIDPVAELEFATDDFEVIDQGGGVARVALAAGIQTLYEPLAVSDGAGGFEPVYTADGRFIMVPVGD